MSAQPGDASYSILRQPARPGAIGPYLGQLGLALAVLLLIPALFALFSGERPMALRYAVVVGALACLSLPFARRRREPRLQVNEGLVITALMFIAPPFLVAWPLMTAGLGYGDALFEAVSGITTTGLSTLATVEQTPPAFLFSRAWLQWIGGLGITALVPLWLEPGPVARKLAGLDVHGADAISPARHFATHILSIYLALTAIACVVLWLLTGDAFAAVVHALAAVSTGGFSSFDDSIAGLGSAYASVAVIVFSIAGAVPLMVYLRRSRSRAGQVFADVQLRALLVFGAVVALTTAVLLVLERDDAWGTALLNGFLLGFSAQSTTGFTSLEIGGLADSIKLVLIFAMVIGGGLGSTAGGIKLLRVLVFLRIVQHMLRQTRLPPHAWTRPRLGALELDEGLVTRTLALFLLYTTTIMVSWLVFVLHHYDPMDALFEVVSALATVGLSTGLAAGDLPGTLQAVLCADMWLGRLEFVALLVLLGPMTWWPRRPAGAA